MKKNGQALVEFIIVLPILIIILLGIIDFGLIFYEKNVLESNLEETTEMWKSKKTQDEIISYLEKTDKDIKLNINESSKTTTIELTINYTPITPGLNKILKSPHEIKVSRVIYNG